MLIKPLLVIPTTADEYQNFAIRVLHYTLIGLGAITLLAFFAASTPLQRSLIGVLAVILGASYSLLHLRRFSLAYLVFVVSFWLLITFATININGIRNSSIGAYVVIIIFTAIFFTNSRAVIVVTMLSILNYVILVVGELQGVLPLMTTPLYIEDRFFQSVGVSMSAGVLVYSSSRLIRKTTARLRMQDQIVTQRNRELEAEIAERRRVEAVLRASEEKYRLLFENSTLLCAVYDRAGTVMLINPAAAAIYDHSPSDLQGQPITALMSVNDAAGALECHARVMRTGTAEIINGHTTLPNGREIYFMRHVMPLPDPAEFGGEIDQVLVITTDVTEQRVAEQRQRELVLAKEKSAFLTEFLGTISHDLKTPLGVIANSLYLLERAAEPDRRQTKIEQITQQVQLMDRYIQDMLMISRLEYMPTMDSRQLDLPPLVEGVINDLKPRIEDKHIDVRVITQAHLPQIPGDADQLRRALVNLVENAVNYTPRAGQVAVTLGRQDHSLMIEVTDTGIGIKPEDVPHVFERFYRAPEARSILSSGTGLGLAIVKKIVDLHQGRIEVSSQSGTGTSFRMYLPLQPIGAS